MAINDTNKLAISIKRLSGKAHTQQNFSINEESVASNVSMSYSTIFGSPIQPNPESTGGLSALYSNDGIVERVKFEVDIIADTQIGTNQSQGYRLKLPSNYTASGYLNETSGTYLHTALGRLQIVPGLYGALLAGGTTEYDPVLYETNGSTEIPLFDPINWRLDTYNGVLFVQDPPAGFDVNASRPGFVEAYLYVGNFVDDALSVVSGATGVTSYNDLTDVPTTFTPSSHTHPQSEVTNLVTDLANKIGTAEKGAVGGVAPLDSSSLIPVIHVPPSFKELKVFPDIASRDQGVYASGDTGTTAQTESFEGFRVFVVDASGDTLPPTGITGSAEYIDQDGQLNWFRLPFVSNVTQDYNNLSNKPNVIETITAGSGLTGGGTGSTVEINVQVDDSTIEINSDTLRIKDGAVDQFKILLGGGTGTTGQLLSSDGVGGFIFSNPSTAALDSLTAQNGVVNVGTSTDPIIEIDYDTGDDTIEDSGSGIRVKAASIRESKIDSGSGVDQINAESIVMNAGTTFTGGSLNVGSALEALQLDLNTKNDNLGSQINVNASNISTNSTNISGNLNKITNTTGFNVGTGLGKVFKDKVGDNINLKSISGGTNISIINNSDDIVIDFTGTVTGSSGIIGPSETGGTYINGLYDDLTSGTTVGTPIDRFNQVLKYLAPGEAPLLDDVSGGGTFVNGNLGWGPTKNDNGFVNVTTSAGNSAVDINGTYSSSGTRLGISDGIVTGILNDDVSGTGIPYSANSFSKGDQGDLVIELNGVVLETLDLTSSPNAISGTYLNVTAQKNVKFATGDDFDLFKFRTGTFSIPTGSMSNGFNYVRITHSGASFNNVTNYLEWVHDDDANPISVSASALQNLTLSGAKNLSGVKYHTSGDVEITGTVSNSYKNVHSSSSTAISFPSRTNLDDSTDIDVTGAGIVNRTTSSLKTMPILDIGASNPQNTDIIITAVLDVNANKLLGNVGSLGLIQSGMGIDHPVAGKSFSGGVQSLTGFLLDTTSSPNDLETEDFVGETNRLEARDYSSNGFTYAGINGGTYAWDSSQSLVGANTEHNTGLLIFNDELIYPNASYLTSTYGITTGNFSGVTNSPTSNVNYAGASGSRDFYRLFKSNEGVTQSTLTFEIDHTGTDETDFLTDGGTGGTVSANLMKLEFCIRRADNSIHDWANPFASSGNPEGIAVTSASHGGGTTTVSCTLSTTPRVGNTDIVVVRLITSSSWANRLTRLAITNI